MSENPVVAILLTKLEAQCLLSVLPPGEEQRKLKNKVMACDIAMNFLQANGASEQSGGRPKARAA